MEFYQIFFLAVYTLLMVIVYAFVNMDNLQKKNFCQSIRACLLFILGGAVFQFFRWLSTPVSSNEGWDKIASYSRGDIEYLRRLTSHRGDKI